MKPGHAIRPAGFWVHVWPSCPPRRHADLSWAVFVGGSCPCGGGAAGPCWLLLSDDGAAAAGSGE